MLPYNNDYPNVLRHIKCELSSLELFPFSSWLLFSLLWFNIGHRH
uniref:Uncharacterized protein n=1 Tax=Arundo donax TaxID=35708 RepID=A0A0A9G5K9_ARUDO